MHIHVVLDLGLFALTAPFQFTPLLNLRSLFFRFNTLLLSVQSDDKEDHESHGAEQNLKAARSLQTTSVMVRPLFSSDQLAYWHLFKFSFCSTYENHDDASSREKNRHDDEQLQ